MKTNNFLTILIVGILMTSCASLRPPIITKNDTIDNYKYIFISPTNSLTSGSGATYAGQYYSSSKTVNPSALS